jgi:hypothetical protein
MDLASPSQTFQVEMLSSMETLKAMGLEHQESRELFKKPAA